MISVNEAIANAKNILDEGGVIGFPTETVYGLAARIDLPTGIEKIFQVKERPFFDPLIVHVATIEQAQKLTTQWGPIPQALAEAFWPGPLTLILPKDPSVNTMITSGLDSVGIRMPNHPVALEILQEVGVPLAAPSANKFGRVSPTSAGHVRTEFKKENVFVVDGGECEIGIESTVLLVRPGKAKVQLSILRRGYILKSDIESRLHAQGLDFEFVDQVDKKESPGHMKHHYMPNVPLIVCTDLKRTMGDILKEVNEKMALLPDEVEGVKIIKPQAGLDSVAILRLSKDPVIATREFYGKLRGSAAQGKDCILFFREPHQNGERWEALFDRLNKAASIII